ncbi:MAG: rhomboid family intramembrane serine protease [Parachlamydiaceae bacterium]
MRLLCTLENEQEAIQLSQYLNENEIANNLEIAVNRDWGSDSYGANISTIWVIEEDQFEKAEQLYQNFQAAPPPPPTLTTAIIEPIQNLSTQEEPKEQPITIYTQKRLITVYLLIFCALLYFIGELTSPKPPSFLPAWPLTALVSSPINSILMFDWPKTYELIADFANQYGMETLQQYQELPRAAKELLQDIQHTPYWQGLYDRMIEITASNNPSPLFNTPLFEKIQQGEVWRLFSPILLHADILHLLFNMLWLFVLGKQIEEKVGPTKYVLFILIAAGLSNTAQYLMTGPNFLGFSGVLCAMLTFIWIRQKRAPWEGYQLQRSTFLFILIFVFGMFTLQSLAFALELYTTHSMGVSIANTAHLSGLMIGLTLGNLPTFARQT